MNKKLLKRMSLILIALFTIISYQSYSQNCDPMLNMEFKKDVSAYTSIYGQYTQEWRGYMYYGYTYAFNLPFTFCYDNRNYTQAYANANGIIQFVPSGSNAPYYYYNQYYGWGYSNNYAQAFGGLLYVGQTYYNSYNGGWGW